ncbi:hypothetical protein BH09PAT3_BH09PAT3_1120 [soil metagenome]
MAIKIDNDLLQQLGLAGLPEVEKNSLLRHIYETLEMRVGMRLADQMTNEQLDEFEKYFDAKDDAGAFKWLEANFPNYKDIVQQEFEKLKVEVGQSAPQILAASQQAQQNAPQPTQPQQPQPMQQQPVQQPQYQQPQPAQPQPYTPPAQAPAPAYQPGVAPVPPQPYVAPTAPPQPYQQPPQQAPGTQSDFPTQQPPAGPTYQQPPQQ